MKNSERVNKGKKKKISILLSLFLVAIMVYLGVSLVGLLSDISKANEEYALAESKLGAVVAQNEELEDLLKSDNYIERIAREKYNYVLPGEEVYADLSGN